MNIEDQVPLIWTTQGNMPVEALEYKTLWEETIDDVLMAEEYRYQGEIVRRSVHIYKKQGAAVGSEHAVFE
jgi:hypothetical protein